jgi:streptogramin lyase
MNSNSNLRLGKILVLLGVCILASLLATTAGAAKPGERHAKILGTLAEGAHIGSLAVTADGTAWFSGYRSPVYGGTYNRESEGPIIGSLSLGGKPTETPLAKGTSVSGPVAVPGGDVWFAESHKNEGAAPTVEFVGHSPAGQTQTYPVGSGVTQIEAVRTLGGDLWFSGKASIGGAERGVIGRVSLASAGAVSIYPLEPGCAAGEALAATADKVWFAEYCPGSAPQNGTGRANLGAVDGSGSITRVPLPDAEQPVAVAAASDAEVWVGMQSPYPRRPEHLVLLEATGTEKQIRVPGAIFAGMAVGSEGRLWYSSSYRNTYYDHLASIGPAGHSSHPIYVGDRARYLILGPDGNLWFSAEAAGSFSIGGGGGSRLMEGESLERSPGKIGVLR